MFPISKLPVTLCVPITETAQAIIPKICMPEALIDVEEALDAYKKQENKTASKLVQELASYHAKKQEQQGIIIQSDFFDLENIIAKSSHFKCLNC